MNYDLRIITLACWLFAIVFIAVPQMSAGQPVHVRDSRLFSIVGQDMRSVAFVRDMTAHFETRVERYFNIPTVRSPILLRLMPVDEGVPGQLRQPEVVVGDFGLVSGSLSWDHNTQLESLCRLIAHSFLTRLAFYEAGESGVERLPAWLVSGLEHDLLFSLRPAISSAWAQGALLSNPMSVDHLLKGDLDRFESAGNHDAFWFFRALLDRLAERQMRIGFFERLLRDAWQLEDWLPLVDPLILALSTQAGVDVSLQMSTDERLRMWWGWARDHQITRHRSFYETSFESEQLLQGLLQLEIPQLGLQGRAGLRQLWDRRDEPVVQEVIEARITLLASRLERMNPLYFNAGHSLVVLYQVLLRDHSMSPDFVRSLSDFLRDYEDARALAREVRGIMN